MFRYRQTTKVLKGQICTGMLLMMGTGAASAASAEGSLVLSGSIQPEKQHRFADVMLEGDIATSVVTLSVDPGDIGKEADLFLVTRVRNSEQDRWYMHDGSAWQPWSGQMDTLRASSRKVLADSEPLQVTNAEQLYAGVYRVYAGYRIQGAPLRYSPEGFSFEVQDTRVDSLVRFSSGQAMEAWLKEGMQATSTQAFYSKNNVQTFFFATDTAATAANTGSTVALAEASASGRTSTTNLQELGVDEADVIKTSGDMLYMLKGCDTGACLDISNLDRANAQATIAGSHAFDKSMTPNGLYLVESAESKQLVALSGQGYYGGWYSIWGWGEQKTALEFLDVSNPANISRTESLAIDGSLVSSRRVGDHLYVVTRYTPVPDGFYPWPADKAQEEQNIETLGRIALPDILPRVEDDNENLLDLIQSRDCYLPTSAMDGSFNPSIITISSIPLSSPKNFTSTCFLGGSEILYMSTNSLYLATTTSDYQMLALDALVYSPQHTTSIHKFALNKGAIEYRGSGQVQGHLGWSEDKKSFRMGENGDYLNVVTSIGDTWNDTSSTRLTVLTEGVIDNTLDTVDIIDGIGKPGEQLYAARFLGDRAYLVNFRITDPLYVLDLSNQEAPVIAGELEIEGYSEYLHPVSESLLLGVGKDALPDDGSTDFGFARGAWYQGVKLSLFDVSDPANPVEIDAQVLGKRGTDTEVLYDHHAFTWLPPRDNEPGRLSMPVNLYENIPQWEGFDPSSPSTWYDYTHTALYSFEISESGISQVGRIISEDADSSNSGRGDIVTLVDVVATEVTVKEEKPETDAAASTALFAPVFVYYPDRAVLKDDAVYYLHEGEVLTSFWGETVDAAPAQ